MNLKSICLIKLIFQDTIVQQTLKCICGSLALYNFPDLASLHIVVDASNLGNHL